MLKAADLALGKGNVYLPRGANALENLRQVLELDPRQPAALKMRNELNATLEKEATADIKRRRLADAKLAIDALVSNDASDQTVAALRKQLGREQDAIDSEVARNKREKEEAIARAEASLIAEQNAARRAAEESMTAQQRAAEERERQIAAQQKADAEASEADRLISQASAMGGPSRVTSVNYRKLAELYGKVLALEPNNSAASRGLGQVSSYTSRQAGFAITGRDFRAASGYIDYLAKISPRSSALPKLREDLAFSKRQQEQAVEILAAADALIATPYKKPGMFGSNAKPRQTLLTAFGKIESARQVDESSPTLARSEQKLVKKYTDIINIHLKDEDVDEAREFLDDLVSTKLAQPQVAVLQQQIEAMSADAEESGQVSVSSF